ncbi:hypothetical protein NONO_c71250 [Nocardia nova SH22a]|uniref:Uncharacterized protein n=1 Tax=Nocardia nova SH22a TaxID=1415166 RepID=W5TXF7_9NOCA|nr:hypothetical protein [Nocardia nova]AHH21886.1 hypothetical protein NONO_c71250 [Nocardia nova SH22a]
MTNGPSSANMSGGGPLSRFRLGFAVGCCVTLLVAVAILALDTGLRRTSDLQRDTQPADVVYSDGSTHLAGVVEVRSWLFRRHVEYQVYTGRDPSMSYGHFVRIGMTGVEPPEFADVRWSGDGVRMRFRSGHELFVPAVEFVGGR